MASANVRGEGGSVYRSRGAERLASSILLKAAMAASGLIWLGFLLGHLGTNAHLFGGPASINDYYAGLKANTALFWGVRVVLAASIAVHVVAATILTRRSTAARKHGYRTRRYSTSTFAARTMPWSGVLLAVFILYHLLHFTTGQAMPTGTTFVEGNDYGNIVSSFSVWYVAVGYIGCLLLLGLHLGHGVFAATLSLGLRHPRYTGLLRSALAVIVVALIGGMLSMPISVLAGLVR